MVCTGCNAKVSKSRFVGIFGLIPWLFSIITNVFSTLNPFVGSLPSSTTEIPVLGSLFQLNTDNPGNSLIFLHKKLF